MAAQPAGDAPGYRPRAASNALKRIAEDALEDLHRLWEERFARDHGPLHPRVRDLMDAFLRCGDPHFGFLRLKCVQEDCPSKTERIVPFSCKARGLCPSCSQKRALLWADRMVREVLPEVPYVQLVFTIPKMLRKAFLFERSLYGEISRGAYADARLPPGALPRSRGRRARHGRLPPEPRKSPQFPPHLHALSSLGVFDSEGRFHPAPEDLDFSPLEELFRERTLAMMLQREVLSEERARMLRGWRHSGFHVDSSRRLAAEDRSGLEQVLVYMERAPVSLDRLEYRREESLVHYRGNWHPSLGRDHQLLPPIDFLAFLVPHVLLRFQCVLRSYGALSTTVRRRFGWIRKPAGSDSPSSLTVRSSKARRASSCASEGGAGPGSSRRSGSRIPQSCPSCGKEMKILAAISSPGASSAPGASGIPPGSALIPLAGHPHP